MWGWLFHRRRRDEELEEEIQRHLRMAAEERIEQGEGLSEARASAVREFGNVALVKEVTREVWGFGWLETVLQDLRYGLRQLRRKRGYTTVAIITLALGIGGTTAIFSVVYGAVLDPFPFADSHRLAVLVSHDIRQGQYVRFASVSAPEFLDYQKQNRVFDEVIGGAQENILLTDAGGPDRPSLCWATRFGRGSSAETPESLGERSF
jgi:hypothetical protein